MPKTRIEAVIVEDADQFDDGPFGVVMFDQGKKNLMIKCPGCGEKSALPLDDSTDKRSPGWKLVSESPLELSPSVHHDVPSCGWHGWLKKGYWVG